MRDSRFISCKRLTFSCLHATLAVSWLRLLLYCCVNVAVRRLARPWQSLRGIPFRLAERPVLQFKTWRSALRRGAFGPVQPAFPRFPAVSVSVSFGAGGAVFQEISRHRTDSTGHALCSVALPRQFPDARFALFCPPVNQIFLPMRLAFNIFPYLCLCQSQPGAYAQAPFVRAGGALMVACA